MILLHAESFQKHVRVFEKTRTTFGKNTYMFSESCDDMIQIYFTRN